MSGKTLIYWLLPLAAVLGVLLIVWMSQRVPKLGLEHGRLLPCPKSPNCVSSEDKGRASWTEPLRFEGDSEAAWKWLREVVQRSGGSIEQKDEVYLRATFRTKVFRFADDVEFRMDAKQQIIHVRSASRVGYSDLNANRKRVEVLRSAFTQKLTQQK